MKEYDRNQERTGIQEAAAYSSEFDVQCDFVMVYGVNDIKKRVKKWKEKTGGLEQYDYEAFEKNLERNKEKYSEESIF